MPDKSKRFFQADVFPKKQINKLDFTTMIPQVDLFSFIVWKKLKTQTRYLEINWPLYYYKKNNFFLPLKTKVAHNRPNFFSVLPTGQKPAQIPNIFLKISHCPTSTQLGCMLSHSKKNIQFDST